jgi:conjugal transfer/type IV secretion protein DotA/TraY
MDAPKLLTVMKFCFVPSGFRPDWGFTRRLFVHSMSLPLITAGLLPADYPTTKKGWLIQDGGEAVSALQLLMDSRRACPSVWNLKTWHQVRQILTWAAVAFAWLSIWVPLAAWLAFFAMGTAHAQAIAQSVVTQVAGNDVAGQWLRGVFGVTAGQVDLAGAQSGLGELIGAYNVAVLGVAGVLAVYHGAAWIMDSAKDGKVGGKNHNTMWGVIRLLTAIFFLVPMAGFNSAQLWLLYGAGKSSEGATNVWTSFTTFMSQGKGMIVTPPLTRQYEEVLGTALIIETCSAAWNNTAVKSGDPPYVIVSVNRQLSVPWSQTVTAIQRAYDGSPTSGKPRGLCGTMTFVPPENKPDAGASLMVAAQRDALMGVLPDVQNLARKLVLSANSDQLVREQNPTPPTAEFRAISNKYAMTLSRSVASAVAAQNAQAQADIQRETQIAGWALAPAWLLTFARLNGSLIDEATMPPKLSAPAAETYWPMEDVQEPMRHADLYWRSAMVDVGRPIFHSTSMGTTQTPMDELLGRFGFAEVVQSYQVQSSDPLAELIAFGHRIINWSMALFAGAMALSGIAGAASAVPGVGIVGKGAIAMINFGAPFLTVLVLALAGGGLTLAVLLPWLPAVRWALACTSWLIGLFEAMLGLPLMLLAIIRTDGNGLLGANRNAGFMLVSLLVRPFMLVVCLVVSFSIFMAALRLWNLLFLPTMTSIQGGTSQGLLIATAHVLLYTGTVWALANISFKCIDVIPSVVIRWAGGHMMADADYTGNATAAVNEGGRNLGTAGQRGAEGVKPPSKGDGRMPEPPREPRTTEMVAKAD